MNTKAPATHHSDQWILKIIWGFLTALFLYNMAMLAVAILVQTQGEIQVATVDDWRVYEQANRRGTIRSHEVHYQLDTANGSIQDWANISEQDWLATQQEPALEVVVWPLAPQYHRAVNDSDGVYGGPITGMLISGSLAWLVWKALKSGQGK